MENCRVRLSPKIRETPCAHDDPTPVALLASGWAPPTGEVLPNWGYLAAQHIPTIALRIDDGTRSMTLLVPWYEAASLFSRLLIHCFEYEHLPPPQAYANFGGTTVQGGAPRWDAVLFRFAGAYSRD